MAIRRLLGLFAISVHIYRGFRVIYIDNADRKRIVQIRRDNLRQNGKQSLARSLDG